MLDGAEHERPLAAQVRHRAVVDAQQLAQLFRHGLAAGGHLHAAAAALEQRPADALLEPAHVLGDRRLREVQRLGGAVIAAVVDDGEERADMAEVEIHDINDKGS